MHESYLNKMKRLFREWYGSLSVEELTSNHELIELIKKIEAQFSLNQALGEQ